MLRIGLTGGIGSGKSLIADRLADLGAAVIDTDAIARELTAPGGSAMGAIAACFGASMLMSTGALDRERMRTLAFERPDARRRLEAILHPLIRAEALRRAGQVQARHPYLVFAVPLLVESGGWRALVDRVLLVDARVQTQIDRITRSRPLERAAVERIVAAQAPRGARIAQADDIVVNEVDLATLGVRIARLHRHYLRLASGRA